MESLESPPVNLPPSRLADGRDQVLDQMAWTRRYTLELVHSIAEELWYVQPEAVQTVPERFDSRVTAIRGGEVWQGIVTPDVLPDDTWFGRIQLVLIGMAITVVTQSSSAGVAIALVALGTGQFLMRRAQLES